MWDDSYNSMLNKIKHATGDAAELERLIQKIFTMGGCAEERYPKATNFLDIDPRTVPEDDRAAFLDGLAKQLLSSCY